MIQSDKSFYLWGWGGNLNAGDDAFLYVTAWGLRRHLKAQRLFVDGDLSGLATSRAGISTAFRSGRSLPYLNRIRRHYYRALADYFVVAGGSLFTTIQDTLILGTDTHWERGGRGRIALGISVGPFRSVEHERHTIALLNSFKLTALRDDFSYEWAVASGVRSTIIRSFDIAVLLPLALGGVAPRRDRTIGVSLLSPGNFREPYQPEQDIRRAEQFGAGLARLVKNTDWKIVALSLCTHPKFSDEDVMSAFARQFPRGIIEAVSHNGDIAKTFNVIRSCSHIIAMRLHGAILAYAAGVPFHILSYHDKCRQFANTIGLPADCLTDVTEPPYNPDLEAIRMFLSRSDLRASLTLQDAQSRALLSFSSLAART